MAMPAAACPKDVFVWFCALMEIPPLFSGIVALFSIIGDTDLFFKS